MDKIDHSEATALVLRDFELEAPKEEMTEEDMLNYLSEVIAYMIENKMDFLLSLLYRLDVDENKINRALSPFNPEPANKALARLVWERQKQRIITKKMYAAKDTTKWDWDIE